MWLHLPGSNAWVSSAFPSNQRYPKISKDQGRLDLPLRETHWSCWRRELPQQHRDSQRGKEIRCLGIMVVTWCCFLMHIYEMSNVTVFFLWASRGGPFPIEPVYHHKDSKRNERVFVVFVLFHRCFNCFLSFHGMFLVPSWIFSSKPGQQHCVFSWV